MFCRNRSSSSKPSHISHISLLSSRAVLSLRSSCWVQYSWKKQRIDATLFVGETILRINISTRALLQPRLIYIPFAFFPWSFEIASCNASVAAAGGIASSMSSAAQFAASHAVMHTRMPSDRTSGKNRLIAAASAKHLS